MTNNGCRQQRLTSMCPKTRTADAGTRLFFGRSVPRRGPLLCCVDGGGGALRPPTHLTAPDRHSRPVRRRRRRANGGSSSPPLPPCRATHTAYQWCPKSRAFRRHYTSHYTRQTTTTVRSTIIRSVTAIYKRWRDEPRRDVVDVQLSDHFVFKTFLCALVTAAVYVIIIYRYDPSGTAVDFFLLTISSSRCVVWTPLSGVVFGDQAVPTVVPRRRRQRRRRTTTVRVVPDGGASPSSALLPPPRCNTPVRRPRNYGIRLSDGRRTTIPISAAAVYPSTTTRRRPSAVAAAINDIIYYYYRRTVTSRRRVGASTNTYTHEHDI